MPFDRKKLRLHYNKDTGEIICRYGWKDIKQANGEGVYGCRHHFRIGDYWLKAEWWNTKIRTWKGRSYTQAFNEYHFLTHRIKDEDRRFFCTLVDSTKRWSRAKVHYTVWPYVKLRQIDVDKKKNEEVVAQCESIVRRLCNTYKLSDVEHRINSNWYIMDGQPLIVDAGLADYKRS